MTNLVLDPTTGYYHRPETMDMFVIKERNGYLKLEPREDDVLLDLGGNIGSVARLFAPLVRYVVSVEPDADNLRVLTRNTEDTGGTVIVIGAACTMSGEPVELWSNGGMNKGSHSIMVKGGRTAVTVPGISFDTLLDTYQPTLLKIDIEGGEWGLTERLYNLPSHVRGIAMELHLNRRDWRDHQAPAMVESLASQGFTATVEPKLTGRRWYTMGVWHR